MPSYEATRAGYAALWTKAAVVPARATEVERIARRVVANRAPYEAVEKACGVPWFFVGCLHSRESGGDFKTHLHNGDRLSGYTRHVPAGRPQVGHGPPFTWTESAIDALTMPGKEYDRIKDWPTERMLYTAEAYNGWGYAARGVNSPYVWGATSLQQPGKYVADHVWSATAMDGQVGVAAILKSLCAIEPGIAARLGAPSPPPAASTQSAPAPMKPAVSTPARAPAPPAMPAPKPKLAPAPAPAKSGLWVAILNLFMKGH